MPATLALAASIATSRAPARGPAGLTRYSRRPRPRRDRAICASWRAATRSGIGPRNGLACLGVGGAVDEVGGSGCCAKPTLRLDVDVPELGDARRSGISSVSSRNRAAEGFHLHPRAVHLVRHDRLLLGTARHASARSPRARDGRHCIFVEAVPRIGIGYCTGLAPGSILVSPIDRQPRSGIDQWPGPISGPVLPQAPPGAPGPWSRTSSTRRSASRSSGQPGVRRAHRSAARTRPARRPRRGPRRRSTSVSSTRRSDWRSRGHHRDRQGGEHLGYASPQRDAPGHLAPELCARPAARSRSGSPWSPRGTGGSGLQQQKRPARRPTPPPSPGRPVRPRS